jgi:hypothetical protein
VLAFQQEGTLGRTVIMDGKALFLRSLRIIYKCISLFRGEIKVFIDEIEQEAKKTT